MHVQTWIPHGLGVIQHKHIDLIDRGQRWSSLSQILHRNQFDVGENVSEIAQTDGAVSHGRCGRQNGRLKRIQFQDDDLLCSRHCGLAQTQQNARIVFVEQKYGDIADFGIHQNPWYRRVHHIRNVHSIVDGSL